MLGRQDCLTLMTLAMNGTRHRVTGPGSAVEPCSRGRRESAGMMCCVWDPGQGPTVAGNTAQWICEVGRPGQAECLECIVLKWR
jgi:hypothetical protein